MYKRQGLLSIITKASFNVVGLTSGNLLRLIRIALRDVLAVITARRTNSTVPAESCRWTTVDEQAAMARQQLQEEQATMVQRQLQVTNGSAHTGDVTAVSAAAVAENALLFDSGATSLMTNSKRGLLSELVPHSATYVTAAGPMSANAKGTYRRTIYGANGKSITFTGQWTYNPKLPFDIAGKVPLRQATGAIYFDSQLDGDAPVSYTHLTLPTKRIV